MNVVVTITYNARKYGILDAFFASMEAQDDRNFLLLVIDNASTDGTSEYLQALNLPNLRLILNEENVGFGRACNQGIAFAREAGAEHITFINNDVEFGPDLIGGMVHSLEEQDAAVLSPLITPFDQPDHIWFITGSFRWRRGLIPYHNKIWQPRSAASSDRIQKNDFVTGCCIVFRMSVFDVIPGFDDRFFVYWEDADLSMEMKKRDMKAVTDTSLVCRHKVSISTGGSFSAFSVYHATRGHLLFARKHYGVIILAYVMPVIVAKMILNLARRRMRLREIRPWFQGLLSGLFD
ncbi:glycosyltransferase family 2 protein [Sphingomonas mollis]|uniref:Glycosyltransferase family 2 protein n=1 Tax=Sphingomonas mollis TaxID=2795726 RepID=A0ABS0XTF7_9SPHN|nr:glycosyltransferase family 2 protein [Sphingomonas sp. BT553]MBJ6123339.1 glycosyltransferase family 2 protein [Sphingomonas sp. BT553]